MDNNKKIHLLIKNKDGKILEEDVLAITSTNDSGLFDILPMHENFISLIHEKITIHNSGESRDIPIDTALLRAQNDEVHIFMGLAATRSGNEIIPKEKKTSFTDFLAKVKF